MLDDLLKLLEEGSGKIEIDGRIVEYDITKDGIKMRITKSNVRSKELEEFVNNFKANVEKLDSTIFESACTIYPEYSGITMHDFAELLDKGVDEKTLIPQIDHFKNAVNNAIDQALNIKYEAYRKEVKSLNDQKMK